MLLYIHFFYSQGLGWVRVVCVCMCDTHIHKLGLGIRVMVGVCARGRVMDWMQAFILDGKNPMDAKF